MSNPISFRAACVLCVSSHNFFTYLDAWALPCFALKKRVQRQRGLLGAFSLDYFERKYHSHNRKTGRYHCSRQLFIHGHILAYTLMIGPAVRFVGGPRPCNCFLPVFFGSCQSNLNVTSCDYLTACIVCIFLLQAFGRKKNMLSTFC